jgi:bacterioferritin
MDRAKSIELLNKGVADELQAVLQYMYWHMHLDDQGFKPLAALMKRIAIMEMEHVENFAERILFLDGEIEMTPQGPVEKITDPEAILKRAAAMEKEAVADYNKYALKASEQADSATKQMFEQMVKDEEGHYDLFDQQLDNLKRFGPNYLALQSFAANTDE